MPRFVRRGRGFRGGSRSRKSVPRWTGLSTTLTPAAGTIAAFSLFDPEAVLALGTNVEQECTVIRIVGQVSVIPAGDTAVSYGLGILKLANTVTPVFGGYGDPIVSAQLIDRDWLRVINGDFNTNALINSKLHRHELDIRVRRRLKQEESIRIICSNAAGGSDITVTIDVRILIVIRA